MKLIEALEIIRRKQRVEAQAFRVGLVCGFTPLHIQTFLNAHLQLVLPESRVEVSPGLYGDFWGNLGSLERADYDAFAVVMEWSDLDPRLGFRSLGSWAPSALADILGNARARRPIRGNDSKGVAENTLDDMLPNFAFAADLLLSKLAGKSF